MNNIQNVQVSNLRDEAANWKQETMIKEQKPGTKLITYYLQLITEKLCSAIFLKQHSAACGKTKPIASSTFLVWQ